MRFSENLERATRRTTSTEAWTDDQFREAREQDLSERTADARSVVKAALGALLLAMLLTSGKLVEIAERQPLGDWRDRQLATAERVDRFANFISLNRPYDLIVEIRGSGRSAGQIVDVIDAALIPTTVPATTVPKLPAVTVSSSTSTSSSTTTTQSPYPLRIVGSNEPLRVFTAGDSQAEYLAQALSSEGGSRPLDVEAEFHVSTGLSRPDYFNWPAQLAAIIAESDPEAVVLFMGANDHQDMADSEGNRLVRDTPEWDEEWVRRLSFTFDLLRAPGRHVFWVTQPPMRDGRFSGYMQRFNVLAQPEIDDRDFVTAVDIWELFGGDDGYSSKVEGPDGKVITARVNDGVHLTRNAASWVADMIFEDLDKTWTFVD